MQKDDVASALPGSGSEKAQLLQTIAKFSKLPRYQSLIATADNGSKDSIAFKVVLNETVSCGCTWVSWRMCMQYHRAVLYYSKFTYAFVWYIYDQQYQIQVFIVKRICLIALLLLTLAEREHGFRLYQLGGEPHEHHAGGPRESRGITRLAWRCKQCRTLWMGPMQHRLRRGKEHPIGREELHYLEDETEMLTPANNRRCLLCVLLDTWE